MGFKILILGVDGYIGWPLAMKLQDLGHKVVGIDNLTRRQRAVGIVDLGSANARLDRLHDFHYMSIHQAVSYPRLKAVIETHKPDIIYHLAQMPSASYSMNCRTTSVDSWKANTVGNLQLLWALKEIGWDGHLVKLGTMGEYGTPGIPIAEGFTASGLPFPRQPGSIYHASKVADSVLCELLSKCWRIRISDIMQGIVFGVPGDGTVTRLDIDEHFGTVINRFAVQAVLDYPMTIYGKGGQTRGFLPLVDSLWCLNKIGLTFPDEGKYEVYNQFGHIWSIRQVADMIQELRPEALLQYIDNPRLENEHHDYQADNRKLQRLGYQPADPKPQIEALLEFAASRLKGKKEHFPPELLLPKTQWRS